MRPSFPLKMLLFAAMAETLSCKTTQGTFGYDKGFILAYDTNAIVLAEGTAQVLVSPQYQGKVFTSSASGDTGRSFGWIHYKAFDGPPDPHMNAYGGENRFWLGPEGGPYSLFFAPGDSMTFAHWKTPAPFDSEPWTVGEKGADSVVLHKEMHLRNYRGSTLDLRVDRTIRVLAAQEIDSVLGIELAPSAQAVGYSTLQTLTNTGRTAWDEHTGMPCMWLLDMFPPSDKTVIVVPYLPDSTGAKPATTDYFGEIPPDRLKIDSHTLFYRADGKSRGKLGIHPSRARNCLGAYDPVHQVLTIVSFSLDTAGRYLNQEWRTDKPVFSGDAVNAYNDGPLADGSQMGPFYELESVSPAAELAPGGTQSHEHSVFHFTGPEVQLDAICKRVLGVSIGDVKRVFAQ